MIVSAFACDLTRIAVVNVMHGTDNVRQDYLHPNSHHEFRSPGPDHDATDLGYYQTQAQFFFDLVEKMDAVVESNGKTMLDNSIVLWTNTLGAGDYHHNNNIPVVTAGGADGKIQTGQFLDFQRRPGPTRARPGNHAPSHRPSLPQSSYRHHAVLRTAAIGVGTERLGQWIRRLLASRIRAVGPLHGGPQPQLARISRLNVATAVVLHRQTQANISQLSFIVQ